jgi:chromate reductase
MFCWASRPSPSDDFGAVFQGRPVGLMASSPGRLGGVRVVPRLRDVVAELGMVAVPGFVTVPAAASAFTEQGRLVDRQTEDELVMLVRRLIAAGQRN